MPSNPTSPKSPPKASSAPRSVKSTPSPDPASGNQVLIPGDHDENDADSSLGSEAILEYRRIQGRTYHADKFNSDYLFPNDDQQLESIDIAHHWLTLLLEGQLFLAPIKDSVQKVLDVGTGSAAGFILLRLQADISSSDFGDQYPSAEIIGTDLSPCQPAFVPPNVRFEIDDATETWTWENDHFDFIHIRYLFGAIPDWYHLFAEAYRCCAPGGWIESAEADVRIRSDDGTMDLEPVWETSNKMYEEGSKVLGRDFFVSDLQVKGMEKAGFTNLKTVDYKIPIGSWPKDPALAQIGRFVQQTLENDLEGYSFLLWNEVLKWDKDEYQVVLMQMRKALRNRKVHSYITMRYVYGQKPE
ncbi:hypothetical protein F53441_8399 [Fusarium austroafricanum]|uniref:Methyltransferase n=1 Tax=Fusarium austroafricanum TaxID=2364996 RepID=A0A8H4KFK9_9HYPO|nr:hypothetical protein F53441_8399 [Fusarium austroafricanum]